MSVLSELFPNELRQYGVVDQDSTALIVTLCAVADELRGIKEEIHGFREDMKHTFDEITDHQEPQA